MQASRLHHGKKSPHRTPSGRPLTRIPPVCYMAVTAPAILSPFFRGWCTMLLPVPTPTIRLGNLFPDRRVLAKCEFLAPSGSFKIRATEHLLTYLLREGGPRELV